MTKLAYLECPTGIAGDMCLGAIVDAGVPLEYLIEKLKALGIEQEYQLRAEPVHRNGQLATKVHVDLSSHHQHHHARHLPEIEELITAARLPQRAEAWSMAVFRRLAAAEGAVHGIPPEQVHFHEVGAVDAIVDIVGTCLGLDWLRIDNHNELPLLYCSALPTGGGTVRTAHGQLAVPVPAVLKLWEMRGCPVYSNGIERELVTPTGAALVTTLAIDFAPPAMTLQRVGLGAGSRDLPIPNILRLWLGEVRGHSESMYPNNTDSTIETISVLETQIDDLSPQALGYAFEALFTAGALDVFTQAIGMKKSRPGILLTVICHQQQVSACETVLFRETTTLGIRRSSQQRTVLQREMQQVETGYGEVRVKVAWMGNKPDITNVQPEYEDCAALARQYNLSWREVHRQALHNWYVQHNV